MSQQTEGYITIPLATLRTLISTGNDPDKRNVEAFHAAWYELEDILRNYDRLSEGFSSIRLGDIVEPKVSRNTLRAGDTAYARAVVLNMHPLFLVSEDGKFDWHGNRVEDFVTVGAVSDHTFNRLSLTWKARALQAQCKERND